LVTCLPTYRTMARYFEFLSQFYGFHLTHPRNKLVSLLVSLSRHNVHMKVDRKKSHDNAEPLCVQNVADSNLGAEARSYRNHFLFTQSHEANELPAATASFYFITLSPFTRSYKIKYAILNNLVHFIIFFPWLYSP
jgi:hypothetical protein